VTQSLLTASRAAPPGTQRIDMLNLLKSLPDVLKPMLPDTITLDIKNDLPSPCWIAGSSLQLHRVITNLAANARDAMPDGGSITIETGALDLDRQRAQLWGIPAGPYAFISVLDTGVGIDAETLENIFDPFFTTKDVGMGTGLGLASAYSIIEKHGGTITVERTLGRGAIFTMYLPLNP